MYIYLYGTCGPPIACAVALHWRFLSAKTLYMQTFGRAINIDSSFDKTKLWDQKKVKAPWQKRMQSR